MRSILFVGLILCSQGATALSQARQTSGVASSREVSTLSLVDSMALVEASARAMLTPSRGASVCVAGIDESLGGSVGAAFRLAGQQAAAARPAAGDSVGLLRFALLGLRAGDTATVMLRISGTVAPPSRAFWVNDIDYRFVRTDTASPWRFVDRRLTSASDYVADAGPVRRRTQCLNRRPT